VTWQKIDNAPRDGRPVFAWRQGWTLPFFVHWALNPRTGTAFWNDIDEWDQYELEEEPPTHWLDLPILPSGLTVERARLIGF